MKKFCLKLGTTSNKLISSLLIICIKTVRPVLGKSYICPFTPGCTQLAIKLLQTKPLYISIPYTCLRVLCCNPLGMMLIRKKPAIKTFLESL